MCSKKKKRFIKGEKKTESIINQSLIEKTNKNKNSHGLKLKLENACEGAKTNGYGIKLKRERDMRVMDMGVFI